MASLEVVVVDVAADGSPGLLDVVPLRQVGFLILEGPEPPLDLDVVSPATLAIHALAYMVLLEEFFVLLTGELAPLIRVQDLWLGHAERLLAGLDTGSGVQRVIQFPSDDAAAVPVNDGCQIQESVLHRDVGDVDGPRLVWTRYIGIPKQIRNHSFPLQTLRKVRLWVDRIDGHFGHPASCLLPSDAIAAAFQLCSHLPGTPGRMIGMQVIDDRFAFQLGIRNRFAAVVNAGSVDAAEIDGYADRNFRLLSRRMEVSD